MTVIWPKAIDFDTLMDLKKCQIFETIISKSFFILFFFIFLDLVLKLSIENWRQISIPKPKAKLERKINEKTIYNLIDIIM